MRSAEGGTTAGEMGRSGAEASPHGRNLRGAPWRGGGDGGCENQLSPDQLFS